MQLLVEKRDIQSNICPEEEIDFRLENNSHVLFEILRNQIYRDPIGSICREITSNSRDSHREANKMNVPIEIVIPGEYLVVRDFGVGMSPERIREVYSVYGASTKRDDNRQTGGFGLGAKCFFAYVDVCELESIYNGIKYNYHIMIDKSQKGKIQLISHESTNEGNGVTIRIPVKPSDRTTFRQKLHLYTDFWEVRPKFLGDSYGTQLPLPRISREKWAVYDKNTYYGYNILCDGIPYQDSSFGIPNTVVLKFETGEIDLSSNREQLRLTDKTKKEIEDAKHIYTKEVGEAAQKEIDKCQTFSEVLGIITTIPQMQDIKTEWVWRGQTFKYPFEKHITSYSRSNYGKTRLNSNRYNIFNYSLTNFSEAQVIHLDKDETNMYDRQRISSYMRENEFSTVYLVDKDQVPFKTVGLSTIKVIRQKRDPADKKKSKTTVKGKIARSRRPQVFDIESENVRIYTTENIDSIHNLHGLGENVIQLEDKEVQLIANENSWMHLDEYLQENLFNKLTEEEICKVSSHIQATNNYNNFSFLAKGHSDFDLFIQPALLKKYEKYFGLITFVKENNKCKALENEVLPDIYKKYPMLKYVRYSYEEDKKNIKNYVELVEKNQKENSHA
jgi:hypothetical protein